MCMRRRKADGTMQVHTNWKQHERRETVSKKEESDECEEEEEEESDESEEEVLEESDESEEQDSGEDGEMACTGGCKDKWSRYGFDELDWNDDPLAEDGLWH